MKKWPSLAVTALWCLATSLAILAADIGAIIIAYASTATEATAQSLDWSVRIVRTIWLLQLPFVFVAVSAAALMLRTHARAWPWTGRAAAWLLWGCACSAVFIATITPLTGIIGIYVLAYIAIPAAGAILPAIIIVLVSLGIVELFRRRA
jgi:hypothetical protein